MMVPAIPATTLSRLMRFLLACTVFALLAAPAGRAAGNSPDRDGAVPTLPPAPAPLGEIRRGDNGRLLVSPDDAAPAPKPARRRHAATINPWGARTLLVGPGHQLRLPSDAAATAADGDTVKIEPGTYNDCAVWRANRLTIIGLGAGATFSGKSCAGKGIFVIAGDDVTVRNLTFAGARVPDGNGAGIRAEGRNLTVENSRFLDNENGILTGASPQSSLIVRNSRFIGNGVCHAACAHGIYAGAIALLRIEHSTFFETREGHHIKSRAFDTELYDNNIRDGAKGTSSYLVELPNGGALTMRGNTLEKGPRSENETAAVMIGAEGNLHPGGRLIIEGNSFINDMAVRTAFVKNLTPIPAVLDKNVYKGRVLPLIGPGTSRDALSTESWSDRLKDTYGDVKEGLKRRIKSAAADVQRDMAPAGTAEQDAPPPADSPASLEKFVAAMAPNTWREVPNSAIAQVLSRRSEAPDDGAVTGPQSVISAWTGSAYDAADHKWYFFGGGHHDYSGNEVYRFDFDTLKWTRLTRPSALQPATAETPCPMPVVGPSSSHTYDGITFSPPTKTFFVWPAIGYCARGMLYGGGAWEFNPATRQWRHIPQEPVLGIFSDFDPNTGKIVLMRQGMTAYFDPVSRTYSSVTTSLAPIGDYGMGIVVPERKEFWGIDYGRVLFKIELTPDAPGPVQRVASPQEVPAEIGSATGVAWSPRLKRLVYWGGDRTITMLDPATLKWTTAPSAPGPAPSSKGDPSAKVIYSKWKYVADLDVFIGYCNPNRGIWVYRPKDD